MTDRVLTVEQMQAAERATMVRGVSERHLMRCAGEGAAQWVHRLAGGRPISVLCGPGNNGGDGYVIAEWLKQRGYDAEVIAPLEAKSDAARWASANFTGPIRTKADGFSPVVVDCLFGYGLSRPVEGEFAELLQRLATARSMKIAIDLPSSVNGDDGQQLGPLVDYDLTLALGAWKRAHFLMPAMASMGTKRLVSLDLEFSELSDSLSDRPKIHAPAPDAHKYKRGLLAVVAGPMPGASLLAAQAAMRSGAGYVKLVGEHSHPDAPADLVVDGRPPSEALEDERISAVLIGPGLGRDEAAREQLSAVIDSGKQCVLDADALHLLRSDLSNHAVTENMLVTPHEGEMAKLCEAFEISFFGKLDRAKALADQTGMTVLAKGPDTILVGVDGTLFFPRGSSWLSIAGTGDVLAGIAASRLAHHGDIMRAGEEAVWLHHEAALRAGPAFTASALAHSLGYAMASLL